MAVKCADCLKTSITDNVLFSKKHGCFLCEVCHDIQDYKFHLDWDQPGMPFFRHKSNQTDLPARENPNTYGYIYS